MERKRFVVGVVFGLLMVGMMFAAVKVFSEQAEYQRRTQFVSQDEGNVAKAFTVKVGTQTAISVYAASVATNTDTQDRLVMIQNIQAYQLYCSTAPTGWSDTFGSRWIIYPSTGAPNTFFTRNSSQIWCMFEAASGATTKEVIGRIEFDSRD